MCTICGLVLLIFLIFGFDKGREIIIGLINKGRRIIIWLIKWGIICLIIVGVLGLIGLICSKK